MREFLKNWLCDVVVDVAKSCGIVKKDLHLSMVDNDNALNVIINLNNEDFLDYWLSPSEDRNGQIVFIDNLNDNETKECRTKQEIYDYLINNIKTHTTIKESTLNETVDIVDEVRDLLKLNGYDEDTIENDIMDYSFIDDLARNGYNAEEIMDELLDAVYGNVDLDVNESTETENIEDAIRDNIENVLKPKIEKVIKGGMYGIGIAAYKNIMPSTEDFCKKYIKIYRDEYLDDFCDEFESKYKIREIGAVMTQDAGISKAIKETALEFAKEAGYIVAKAYITIYWD